LIGPYEKENSEFLRQKLSSVKKDLEDMIESSKKQNHAIKNLEQDLEQWMGKSEHYEKELQMAKDRILELQNELSLRSANKSSSKKQMNKPSQRLDTGEKRSYNQRDQRKSNYNDPKPEQKRTNDLRSEDDNLFQN